MPASAQAMQDSIGQSCMLHASPAWPCIMSATCKSARHTMPRETTGLQQHRNHRLVCSQSSFHTPVRGLIRQPEPTQVGSIPSEERPGRLKRLPSPSGNSTHEHGAVLSPDILRQRILQCCIYQLWLGGPGQCQQPLLPLVRLLCL